MTVLFIDGFDHYNTAQLQAGYKWSSSYFDGDIAIVGGAFKSTGALSEFAYSYIVTQVNASDQFVGVSTFVAGFSLKVGATQPNHPWAFLWPYGFFDYIYLQFDSSRHIVLSVSSPTNVVATGSTALDLNKSYWIEWKINTVTGNFSLYVNGKLDASFVYDFFGGTMYYCDVVLGNSVDWEVGAPPYEYTFDNVYVGDSMEPLGRVKVITKLPNANGSVDTWTPDGATTNFQAVDEAPHNDDTSRVIGGAGELNEDLYGFPSASGRILAVQTTPTTKFDYIGCSRAMVQTARIGGVDYDAVDTFSGGGSYSPSPYMWRVNPATGLPWTSLSGTQFGVKVTQ